VLYTHISFSPAQLRNPPSANERREMLEKLPCGWDRGGGFIKVGETEGWGGA